MKYPFLSFSQNFIQPEEIVGLKDFFDEQIWGFEALVNMPRNFSSSVDHLVNTLLVLEGFVDGIFRLFPGYYSIWNFITRNTGKISIFLTFRRFLVNTRLSFDWPVDQLVNTSIKIHISVDRLSGILKNLIQDRLILKAFLYET